MAGAALLWSQADSPVRVPFLDYEDQKGMQLELTGEATHPCLCKWANKNAAASY